MAERAEFEEQSKYQGRWVEGGILLLREPVERRCYRKAFGEAIRAYHERAELTRKGG